APSGARSPGHAPCGVELVPEAVVGAVERQIADADIADAAVRLAADRHAVTAAEVVVGDDQAVDDAGAAALDRDVVVAGRDFRVSDDPVLGPGGVDAVGVGR